MTSFPMGTDFRNYILPDDDPRLTDLRELTVREYAEYAKTDPFAGPMITGWAQLYPQPYVGVTTDGIVRPNLFRLNAVRPGEEAPTKEMVVAAEALLATLDEAGRDRVSYPVDAHEWRSWANPEFLQHDTGIRLDEVGPATRDAALNLLAATLSPQGYQLARTAMTINGYLGEIVDLHHLMNEFSYNLAVYGEPSTTQPWGWQLFGHHLALNALVIGPTMVLTPVFFGAEPNTTDGGDPAGPFGRRIELARAAMSALPTDLRDRAVTYRQMVDPAMPEGRLHPGDERTLAGCFQDNRVIPYEGIALSDMPVEARNLVREMVRDALGYLPAGPLAARLREFDEHAGDTWFSWIGGWRDGEPFYFRIQSPVVLLELDHHCGVFLANTEPAPFHIHTTVRTPNAGDYGKALIAQHGAVGIEGAGEHR
jgi:hypothetical protein